MFMYWYCMYFVLSTSSEFVRVDTEALKKRYTQLQRELHPDKFSTKSEVQQSVSL